MKNHESQNKGIRCDSWFLFVPSQTVHQKSESAVLPGISGRFGSCSPVNSPKV